MVKKKFLNWILIINVNTKKLKLKIVKNRKIHQNINKNKNTVQHTIHQIYQLIYGDIIANDQFLRILEKWPTTQYLIKKLCIKNKEIYNVDFN